MRGEKALEIFCYTFSLGSPPLARGKGILHNFYSKAERITPACAGKRSLQAIIGSGLMDHPRLRGEKIKTGVAWLYRLGSPPLARGKE